MSETSPSSTIRSLQHSQLFRVSAIAFLILLLQIPISMIRTTIREREGNRDQAARAIAESWGDEQRVVGPRLVVPYVTTQEVTHGDGRVRTESTIHYIHVLADTLGVTGTLVSEARYRGIFQVPVFRTHLHFQGVFRRPDVAALDIDPGSIMWDRAVLAMGISDADAIPRQVSVQWNGHTVDFLPGMGWPGSGEGIHAPLGRAARTDEVAFDLSVSVNGTGGVFVVPFGSETRVTLEGDWPDPSFEGTWLPEEREVTAEGFTALWNVPFLGRNYPQQWSSAQGVPDATISASAFGVRLLAPVDHYRMSHRSVKYQFLFLVLTFVSIWLFEVLAGLRVHPVQYLLVGAAMCIFYLLELSLAEHLGFTAAYLLATMAIVGLVVGYMRSVLGSPRRGAIMGGIVTLLYSYLFVLLQAQDYALLAGSLGLFAALAATMYLTRKVDWYALSE